MFENLNWKEFTWKREPILYLALFVAIGNIVLQAVNGDLTGFNAAESIFVLVLGFFGRGQVTPLAR